MSAEGNSQTPGPLSQRFEFVTGTTIREANAGREDVYRPWEAPGLGDRYVDGELKDHQADVDRMIHDMIEGGLSLTAPQSTRGFVTDQLFGKDAIIDSANKAGYQARAMRNPRLSLTPELQEIRNKVLLGTATPEEIDIHMRAVRASSAELAELRTVGGLRTEHEQPMLDDVGSIMGENVTLSAPEKLEIVEYGPSLFEGDTLNEILIRFKREFNGDRDDDNTVKSRHRLVIATGPESGFDQDVARAIALAAKHAIEHGLSANRPLDLRRPRQAITEIAETGSSHPDVAASIISAYEVDPNHPANVSEEAA